MEQEGSLPHSQQPDTFPYPESDRYSPWPSFDFSKIIFDIILPDKPRSSKRSFSPPKPCVIYYVNIFQNTCAPSQSIVLLLKFTFISVAQQPKMCLCGPIAETCKSHTHVKTPLSEWSARRKGRYLHNTQETKIHVLGGIRNRNFSNQTAADVRLRRHGIFCTIIL
jgi:hypothetical protein